MEAESHRRVVELKSYKLGFSYAAAFFIGGAMFSSAATYDTNPLSTALIIVAVVCMWSAYQIGNHVESINRQLGRSENEPHNISHLKYLISEKLYRIILP